MKRNVGRRERMARIAAGSALLGYAVWKKNWKGFIGSIPLVTGLLSYCPVNEMLGMKVIPDMRKKKNKYPQPDSAADKSFHSREKTVEGNDDTGGFRTGRARKH
jgi:hypothetical protein